MTVPGIGNDFMIALTDATQAAVEQGIPVLAFAYEIPGATCSVISATDEDMGTACAQMASDWIDENYADAADGDVIICMNGTCGGGTESYVMSGGSPIEDKSKFAVFCVDETDEIISKIQASVNNESVLRGTVSMGDINATVTDFTKALTPMINGEEPVSVDGVATIITPDTL